MVKKKSSAQCSAAGKALAGCRWGPAKKKKAGGKKPKARKLRAPVRKSRRLAGQGPVRGPEPKKKARKKKAQKAGPLKGRTAASKKVEEILVPGLNPKKGDMKSFIDQQRRLYA